MSAMHAFQCGRLAAVLYVASARSHPEYRGGDFSQWSTQAKPRLRRVSPVDERGRKGITLERRITPQSVRRDLARAIARAKQRPRRAAFYHMGR